LGVVIRSEKPLSPIFIKVLSGPPGGHLLLAGAYSHPSVRVLRDTIVFENSPHK
jgi:hypothetical protein